MRVEDWLGEDNKLGIDIWKNKYQEKDGFYAESFDHWLDRVSGGDSELREMIVKKQFLFGGRILANRGLNLKGVKVSNSNCYVIPLEEDSIEGIFKAASDMARTFSYGGGVGIDISKLAPAGAKVNNAAGVSTGAVSFVDLFSTVTGLIGQKGRRGATMISIDCTHPDLEQFIALKTDVNRATKANLSVKVNSDFMNSVIDGTNFIQSFKRPETGWVCEVAVSAKVLFDKLCDANYDYGEPGILFWDTIKSYNLLSKYNDFEYAGVNPCFTGDMRLYVIDKYRTQYKSFAELEGRDDITVVKPNGQVSFNNKVWCSGVKDIVRLKTSRGNDIKCTPDHVFMLDDGTECEAKDLKGKNIKTYDFMKNEVLDVIPMGQAKVYDFTEKENHWGIVECCIVHNCAEEPLPAGGSCLLGSLNLDAFVHDKTFDYPAFKKAVHVAVRALNAVLDEGIPLHPLEIQRQSVTDWRQIGLGIMGLADALIHMEVGYNTSNARDVCSKIAWTMITEALDESVNLAKAYGPFPKFRVAPTLASPFLSELLPRMPNSKLVDGIRVYGLRNSQLLCIAPTGTISTMLGVSGGIEPLFATHYDRVVKSLNSGKESVYHLYPNIVKDVMKEKNITDVKDLPDYVVTAKEIDYKDRIDMQAVWQHYIDASISSTVNLPEDFPKEDVKEIYLRAWRKGCKGVTVFRDGCKRDSILTTKEKKEEPQTVITAPYEKKEEKKSHKPVNENLIGIKRKLVTGCGNLHVLAYYDRNGVLREVYLNKGSTGGCHNFMNGLSRMISLCAKNNVPLEDIIDQLKSCGACPSYAVRSATHKDTSKGSCCPMAIGNALLDMQKEVDTNVASEHTDTEKLLKDREGMYSTDPKVYSTFHNSSNESTHNSSNKQRCPQCGGELSFTGGCNTCVWCGYSKCE